MQHPFTAVRSRFPFHCVYEHVDTAKILAQHMSPCAYGAFLAFRCWSGLNLSKHFYNVVGAHPATEGVLEFETSGKEVLSIVWKEVLSIVRKQTTNLPSFWTQRLRSASARWHCSCTMWWLSGFTRCCQYKVQEQGGDGFSGRDEAFVCSRAISQQVA